MTLRTFLDGRFAAARDEVRAELAGRHMVADPELSTEQYRDLVRGWMGELAASGRPRRGFDPAHGGEGDVGGVVASFAALAYGDLSLLVKAGVQWGLFGGALANLGNAAQHERYLRPMMDGTLPGCFAMTETGHGSDVANLLTTATYDAACREFVIHTPEPAARKDYIGGAARDATMAVVFAQLHTAGAGHGVHAFLVPIRAGGRPAPGVTISDCGHKAGLGGVDNGRLAFDGVRVPREALLDRYGTVAEDGTYASPIANDTRRFFTMLGTLVRGRISVAGGAGAAAEKALTLAVRYGGTRRQFADPATGEETVVLDYLVHQRKLLPALATTYALHVAQDDLVARMHALQRPGAEPDEAGQRELETRAAGVKAVGTWHATATIQACREACGGAGYLSANLLPRLKADTDVFTTFEGDNTVLLQLVAKNILSDHARRMAADKIRFVAGLVAGQAVERAGLRPLLHRGDVREPGHQRRLLAARAQHLLGSAALRMRPALAPGADQFAVFNAAQDHLLAAARAWVEHVVFTAFADAVAAAGPERALLERVLALHGLAVLERERAWFLEHGYLTARGSRAITAGVNALCGELRPHARELVDAFGIPELWLECPMLSPTPDRRAVLAAPA